MDKIQQIEKKLNIEIRVQEHEITHFSLLHKNIFFFTVHLFQLTKPEQNSLSITAKYLFKKLILSIIV